ncbi:hypothetical protein JHK87_027177 [Glycine soja]|nr:hypothetical protein JHK87_027177 [Glycine soja]
MRSFLPARVASPLLHTGAGYQVLCNNLNSHALQLHLNTSFSAFYHDYDGYYEFDEEAYRRWSFGGAISSCLADLKHLNYLDLSGNDFEDLDDVKKNLLEKGGESNFGVSSQSFIWWDSVPGYCSEDFLRNCIGLPSLSFR